MNDTLYKTILDIIKNMNTSEANDLFNSYNEHSNNYEFIYSMYDLDDLLSCRKPSEILNSIDKDFNINDDYFYDTCYGLRSFSYISDCDIFLSEDIAQYIIDNMEDLGNKEISDILEEYEND